MQDLAARGVQKRTDAGEILSSIWRVLRGNRTRIQRPVDADVEHAAHQALKGLMQAPAA
jgi:hypothetical protein